MNKMQAILTIVVSAVLFAALGYLAVWAGLNKLYFSYAANISAPAYALVGSIVGAVFGGMIVLFSKQQR